MTKQEIVKQTLRQLKEKGLLNEDAIKNHLKRKKNLNESPLEDRRQANLESIKRFIIESFNEKVEINHIGGANVGIRFKIGTTNTVVKKLIRQINNDGVKVNERKALRSYLKKDISEKVKDFSKKLKGVSVYDVEVDIPQSKIQNYFYCEVILVLN